MKVKAGFFVVLLAVFVFSGHGQAETDYGGQISKWRSEREADLKKESGWLTVVGLFWLKNGKNTIGSGQGFDIELTDNFKAGSFGEVNFDGGRAVLTVADNVEATNDGKPVKTLELVWDETGKPTVIKTGSQSFYLIKREGRFGIRLKDENSKARREFTHLNWYAIKPKLRVNAKFEKYPEPKDVLIPNVLGGEFKMRSPGLVKFQLRGKTFELQTIDEGDGKLFIIFRDLTSRTETYGAGRFLYADKPTGDSVVLDFNKAENPPCAFTEFATCPLPPRQNRMQIAIAAGEKRYGRIAGK
ncbi:MAG TPA: DUF1684 domain-containing protein [Pyrinomonadaceae bacterium]|nr:DUF1684 domain-containing protein [Pyrinomonadaceae bacterium]